MITHENIDGWYDWHKLNEWLVLNRLPQGAVYVECGVWFGKSLVAFGQLCQRYGKRVTLYGVDLFGGKQDDRNMDHTVERLGGSFFGKTQRNLLDANVDATLIRADIDDAATRFQDESVDLILIDGLHDYASVKRNTLSWMPKLKKGGFMLWHDADRDEVKRAIRDSWGDKFEVRAPRMAFAVKG